MKPDWKDAPEWATWLAMDDDGRWFWYELKPEKRISVWRVAPSQNGRFSEASDGPNEDWKISLELRP